MSRSCRLRCVLLAGSSGASLRPIDFGLFGLSYFRVAPRKTSLIHTPHIIEESTHAWRQLLKGSICKVAAYLDNCDELAEIVFTMRLGETRLYASWQQEDGATDNRLFYGLSLQNHSHFKPNSLVSCALSKLDIASMVDSQVASIRLFGVKTDDNVLASLVEFSGQEAFGIATTRWLANKGRFARCGRDELCVLSASQINSLVANQRLDLVAEITS